MDAVSELATYLVANAKHCTVETLTVYLATQCPDMSGEDVRKAFALARQTLRNRGDEYSDQAEALEAIAEVQRGWP